MKAIVAEKAKNKWDVKLRNHWILNHFDGKPLIYPDKSKLELIAEGINRKEQSDQEKAVTYFLQNNLSQFNHHIVLS